jgi:hypothetical protein
VIWKESPENPKVSAKTLGLVLVPVGVILLTALLPLMFPDSWWINFLFGEKRFILFWVVVGLIALIFVDLRPKGPK